MTSSKQEFRTAVFEDGTCAVLRADTSKPHLLEVIATFHDAAHARDYVRSRNTPSEAHQDERPVRKEASAAKPKQVFRAKPQQPLAAESKQASKAALKKVSEAKPAQASAARPRQATAARPKAVSKAQPSNTGADITERQTAVLKALRSMMDKKHRVEVRKSELAKASSIPLGSVHNVLTSLEKKRLIRTERQASVQLPAIYEVLETAQKTRRSLNGVVRGKEARAATH